MPGRSEDEDQGTTISTRNGRSKILEKIKRFAFKKQVDKFESSAAESVSETEDSAGDRAQLGNGHGAPSPRTPPAASDEALCDSSIKKTAKRVFTDSESEDAANGTQSRSSDSNDKLISSSDALKSCIRNSYQLLSASKLLAPGGLQLANGSFAGGAAAEEPTPSDFSARIKRAFINLHGKRMRRVVESSSSSDEEQTASPPSPPQPPPPPPTDKKMVDEDQAAADSSSRKRGRFVIESSDEGSDRGAEDEDDESSNQIGSAESNQEAEIQRKEMCLSKVTALFPQWDYMELQDILIQHDWSVDKSIDHLQKLTELKHSHRKRMIRIHSESSDEDGSGAYEGPKAKRKPPPSRDSGAKGVNFASDDSNGGAAATATSTDIGSTREMQKPSRRKQRHKCRAEDAVVDDTYIREQEVVYDSDASDIDDTLTPARQMVLDFYAGSTLDELMGIPSCSKKKAEAIVDMRPFSGWCDLVKKFQSGRGVSTELLNKAKEILHSRKIVTQLMKKCGGLAERMEECVARLMSGGGGDDGYLTDQPELLNEEMRLSPYQMLGLNWLVLMHQQKVSGILADEMGLGKTVQTIAFLAHLMAEGNDGPHLIIVPASTLDNWVRELQTWWPTVNILTYRGSLEERRYLRMRILKGREDDFNVLVTTYTMAAGSSDDRSLFRKVGFRYVVYDEAHLLKNMETLRYQYLMKIQAERRLLLTGTPLQNNLVELMSLLVFVMPNMFEGKIGHLKNMFTLVNKDTTEEGRSSFERDRIEQAKNIMKPFVLRRLKAEVLHQLPEKTEEVVHCRLALNQREQYDELVIRLSRQVRDNQENHLAVAGGNSGMAMMMQLRRLANHPLLLRYIFTDDVLRRMAKLMLKEPSHSEANSDLIFEDMQVMSDFELHKLCKMYRSLKSYVLEPHQIVDSGKFIHLNEIMSEAKRTGERILLFSQFVMMLDIVEEYMEVKGHKCIRLDGSTAVTERQELIDKFTRDESIDAFLLSTRAGGLGINLTAANVVVLHDIDFNPYNDKQAEDRCHRIGQTRAVRIVRLVSKDTIEEGILASAQRKLKLEKEVTSSNSKAGDDEPNDVASLLKEALNL